jgi:hypothetical protein
VDGFAIGIGGDEIEESKQCVLIGPELLDGPTRPFGSLADFDVTVECLLDHVQQPLSLWPLEIAFDLFCDFQQAISELGSIRTSPDSLFPIPRHGGWKCNQRAPMIRGPVCRDC